MTILYNVQYNSGMDNKNLNQTLEKMRQEIRRGNIVLAAMSQLREEQYGYSLLKRLNEKGYDVGQDTLYPLLRRLEEQGLLDSEWRVDGSRPRRYYVLNETGLSLFEELKTGWQEEVNIIRRLINETE